MTNHSRVVLVTIFFFDPRLPHACQGPGTLEWKKWIAWGAWAGVSGSG